MKPISLLESYINQTIPYAWDDSESWYEFLGKVLAKVNEVVAESNDYFADAFTQYALELLEKWSEDGTLATVINDNLTTQLEQTNIYMDEYLINVKKYGVKGDGLTNDFDAIRTVINEHRNVYFPEGEYMLGLGSGIANRGIYIPSNTTILFHPKAKLKLLPHDKTHYEIFHLADVENIKIINPVIDGNRENNAETTSEHGHGIAIRGSKNVIIKNANITNCWGDGIYVGNSDTGGVFYSENIVIENPICDNNRRQGMSIISAKGLRLINPTFSNTNGTAPESGIDIEPNGIHEFLQDIVIENYKNKTNEFAGLNIYLKSYSNSPNPVSITVKNMVSDGDNLGLYVTGGENIQGFINIENPTFLNNGINGIRLLEYNYVNPLLKITNPHIINCNVGNYADTINSAGISIFNALESVSTHDIGNISIENLIVEETRTNKIIETAIYIENKKNVNGVRDIHIIDPVKLDVSRNYNMVLYGDGITIKDGNNILTLDMNNSNQAVYEHRNFIKYTTKGNTLTQIITIIEGSRIGRTLEFVNVTGTELILLLNDENILMLEGAEVSCTQKGSSLSIEKITSTEWRILNKVGTWTATPAT